MSWHWRWVGPGLIVAGVVVGFWPDGDVAARSRAMVTERTWPRRGPVVVVAREADRIRDGEGRVWSISAVLSADGYRVRPVPYYLSRDALGPAQVLVTAGPAERVSGTRERLLVRRWEAEGGRLLDLTSLALDRCASADVVQRLLQQLHRMTGVPEPTGG